MPSGVLIITEVADTLGASMQARSSAVVSFTEENDTVISTNTILPTPILTSEARSILLVQAARPATQLSLQTSVVAAAFVHNQPTNVLIIDVAATTLTSNYAIVANTAGKLTAPINSVPNPINGGVPLTNNPTGPVSDPVNY